MSRPEHDYPIMVKCENCGKEWQAFCKKQIKRYCSTKCAIEVNSKLNIGKTYKTSKDEYLLEFDSTIAEIRYTIKDRKLSMTGEVEYEMPLCEIPKNVEILKKKLKEELAIKWLNELMDIYKVWRCVRT